MDIKLWLPSCSGVHIVAAVCVCVLEQTNELAILVHEAVNCLFLLIVTLKSCLFNSCEWVLGVSIVGFLYQSFFILSSKAHMLPFSVSSIMYKRKCNHTYKEICQYICSLAVVMLILMCDEVSNTDVGSCFTFCCIIIIVANNFKFLEIIFLHFT
jgi:hypothetical protein